MQIRPPQKGLRLPSWQRISCSFALGCVLILGLDWAFVDTERSPAPQTDSSAGHLQLPLSLEVKNLSRDGEGTKSPEHAAAQDQPVSSSSAPTCPPERASEPDRSLSSSTVASRIICSEFPIPKVAFCIAGNARTFHWPVVHQTMKAALDGTGADVTFFAYLKLWDAEQKRNHVMGAQPLNVNLETIQPALRVLNITQDRLNILETEEVFHLNQNCGWRPGTELSQENILKRVIGQGVSSRECYKLVTQYEQKHDMKFDYVFRGRPDTSFMDPLPAYCFWGLPTEDVFLRDPWIDHLFGTTRKHSDRLFNMIDEVYYNCHNRNRPEGIAEDILAGMVRVMGLREKTFPHSTVVTRFVGPSTCGGLRLPMIDGAMCDKVTVFNPSNPVTGTPRITPA